jgi:hypothetical protein
VPISFCIEVKAIEGALDDAARNLINVIMDVTKMQMQMQMQFRVIIVVQIATERMGSRGSSRSRDMVLVYRQDDGPRGTGEWKWECTWQGDYSAWIKL